MTVLQSSELHADTDRVLDAAKDAPQYVLRDGVLLVITRLRDDSMLNVIADTWEQLGPAPEIDYDRISEG